MSPRVKIWLCLAAVLAMLPLAYYRFDGPTFTEVQDQKAGEAAKRYVVRLAAGDYDGLWNEIPPEIQKRGSLENFQAILSQTVGRLDPPLDIQVVKAEYFNFPADTASNFVLVYTRVKGKHGWIPINVSVLPHKSYTLSGLAPGR